MRITPAHIATALVDVATGPNPPPFTDACDGALKVLHTRFPGYPLSDFVKTVVQIMRRRGHVPATGSLITPAGTVIDLSPSLDKAFGEPVDLQHSTDDDLIGGAVLLVGDLSIDNSIRTSLERLYSTVAHSS